MKKIFLISILGCFLISGEAVANWSLGLQGHSGWLMNDSAKNNYENPTFGGHLYVYYAPEMFWDFVGIGMRSGYTNLRAKTSTNASDINSIDALLSGRLIFLDEPGEDWAIDLHLDLGTNYMMPSSADNQFTFAYAVGSQLRYFAFEEHSIGIFLRFHQALGSITVGTNTKVKNFSSFQAGVTLEFNI